MEQSIHVQHVWLLELINKEKKLVEDLEDQRSWQVIHDNYTRQTSHLYGILTEAIKPGHQTDGKITRILFG